MDLKIIRQKKNQYNKLVTHVMQSWQWGEFRKSLGTKILKYGLYNKNQLKTAFQITFHKIPLLNQYVGYLPKGPMPDKNLAQALKKIGQENNCAFIKIEPNIELPATTYYLPSDFHKSPKPLFTKYNFVLDLTKSEAELLQNLHPKTRYNIKVAQKHGVKVEERFDDEALDIYLRLYFETTKRQNYHGHTPTYHQAVWAKLKKEKMARFLIAFYQNEPLTAWMLINFQDTLYYPYGGSSKAHPEVMANNLVAWKAILLGKRLKLKNFDMWGALGPNASLKDPWHGFHRFKQGYGGKLVEYIGTYDLVFNWPIYLTFTIVDRLTPLKVFLLKLVRK
ncbi:MAG: peptidoglycan bridge formation glycyltransferase FemA/FemB family protein [Candidatus Daviesbacteria bacterium]|nr:MAG: peptidoglycan bridge formation glycyltransferase FemA/FemB family protein [Candidatus Daviesbacteria bacterium]